MKNTLFLLFALLGATLNAQPAQQLIDEAITLSTQGDYVASNNLLTTLIDQYPTRKYDLSEAAFLKSENHLALGNLEYAKIANELSLELHQAIIPEEVGRNLLQAGIIAVASANYEEAIELLNQAEQYPFIDAPATPAEIKFLKGMAYEQLSMTDESVDAIQEGIAIQEIVGDIDKARSLEDFKALLRLKPVDRGMLNSFDLAECTNWYLLSKITYEKAKALRKVYASNQDKKALQDAYQLMLTSIEAFEPYGVYLSAPVQHDFLLRESKKMYDLGIELSLLLNEQDSKEEYVQKAYELAERSKWFKLALEVSRQEGVWNSEKGLEYRAQYNAAINQLALGSEDPDAIRLVLKERKAYIDYTDSIKQRLVVGGIGNGDLNTLQDQLDKKQVVFYYYLGSEVAYVLMVNKSDVELKAISDPKSIRDNISTYNAMAKGEEKKQYSCQFYDQLLEAVAKTIRSKKMLFIHADERLNSLPFDQLLKECPDEKNIRKWANRLAVMDISLLAAQNIK